MFCHGQPRPQSVIYLSGPFRLTGTANVYTLYRMVYSQTILQIIIWSWKFSFMQLYLFSEHTVSYMFPPASTIYIQQVRPCSVWTSWHQCCQVQRNQPSAPTIDNCLGWFAWTSFAICAEYVQLWFISRLNVALFVQLLSFLPRPEVHSSPYNITLYVVGRIEPNCHNLISESYFLISWFVCLFD